MESLGAYAGRIVGMVRWVGACSMDDISNVILEFGEVQEDLQRHSEHHRVPGTNGTNRSLPIRCR
jgi:hypothetical protein